MAGAIAYRAAWIFPVASPPVRDGVLEVDAAGRVSAIRSGPDGDAVDLGEVAVVPALVNAHAHLEFSDLRQPIGPPRPFSEWVRNVVGYRRGRGESDAAVRLGLDEAARCGTGAVGEIATSDDLGRYMGGGPEAVVFRELIGPLPEAWPGLLGALERRFVAAAGRVRLGVSPHAPYTVPQELFERSVGLAERHGAPVAVHLAETPAELELFAAGTGELVEMMRSLGLWRPELHPNGRRPLDWLRVLAKAPRGLVVHGNFLDDEELEFLADAERLTLVYCPRTHAYFGHGTHPFRRLLGFGGRVALGTDGRSSNPDLSLWREAVFLRTRHPDLASDTILELATRCGAEALGVSDRHGVLAVGRYADFSVVSLRSSRGGAPPDLFVPGQEVARVFRLGTELHSHDGEPACQV